MKIIQPVHSATLVFCALVLLAGCSKKKEEVQPDHPRLTPKVTMQDITFHSSALNRDMQYRAILPASIAVNQRLPVVYMLHGNGGNFRDWSNYSDVAHFAERGLILVMPQGDNSYYTNSAERPQDRYEDYIVKDLISDVETRFPAATGRQNRAIVGVSMGGYGAVKIALAHPELFAFAGGFSSAVDVPNRPFSMKRIPQWRLHRSIFGPWGGPTQRSNDPFVLAHSVDAAKVPYLFLTCGEQEGLLPANQQFAALLSQRHIPHEFHTVQGGHDWNQWNGWVSLCFQRLLEHINHAADPL